MSKTNHHHSKKQTKTPTNIKHGTNEGMEFRKHMFLQMAIHLTVELQPLASTSLLMPEPFLCPAQAANTQTDHPLPQLSVGRGLEGRDRLAESSLEKGRGLCIEKHPLTNFLSCERINDSRM